MDRFLEDESLFGEFLRAPVSEGGVEPRERGLLVDDIRHAAVVSGFRAAVMAVVEIVAAGRRPDRAAIDQTARRIAQGDGPESRARLDTYSRFMREDGDE